MSIRKRLKSSMRGAKSKSHRLLSAFRAKMFFRSMASIVAIRQGLATMQMIKNTRTANKEEKAAKALALAECVIATTKAAYAPFDTIYMKG